MANYYDTNQPVLGVPRDPPRFRPSPAREPTPEELARALRGFDPAGGGLSRSRGLSEHGPTPPEMYNQRLPGMPALSEEELRRRMMESFGPGSDQPAPLGGNRSSFPDEAY
jgi:hypothetical protein